MTDGKPSCLFRFKPTVVVICIVIRVNYFDDLLMVLIIFLAKGQTFQGSIHSKVMPFCHICHIFKNLLVGQNEQFEDAAFASGKPFTFSRLIDDDNNH